MDEKETLLVARSQEGDAEAFGELVSLYQKRIYDLAYQMVHNHADAEDIAQEVFIRLYKKIHKFKGRSSFLTWLYRMTMNVCKNYLRSRTANTLPFEDAIGVQDLTMKRDNPAEELISKETNEAIGKAIDTLPFRHRMVIILHDIEGFSHKDISKIIGCSEGTVWSRLFYARKKLKEKLTNLLKSEKEVI
ncbi:sigma-70 family RNA polymerase sigma factor [bacterium]|nr:sigma-70 family RNA polymerase sigma factor [bacterium]